MANGHIRHDVEFFDSGKAESTDKSKTITIPSDLFEKLYLPHTQHVVSTPKPKHTFGNPTPIALAGILIALTPLACVLMGWRGAGGGGASGTAAYFFFGGLLSVLSGVLEWVLGNSFASIVYCSYGAFFLTLGGTLTPAFFAFDAYAPAGENPSAGLETTGFNAGFGFFFLWMAVLSFVFLICSVRTNVCFFIVFLTLTFCYSFLAGAYWMLAADFEGNANSAGSLVHAAGGSAFITCLAAWWVFLSSMLAVVDFPFQLPVGDLSRFIKGASQKSMV
mgnify:CR=1 FL=1